jgi:hypothetical protein
MSGSVSLQSLTRNGRRRDERDKAELPEGGKVNSERTGGRIFWHYIESRQHGRAHHS